MSPTTSSNPKAVFYEAALSDALTAGAWADATPSKSLKAEAISWGELERKLAKHTGDSIAGDLASHLLTLSLLLSAPSIPLPESKTSPHHTRIHRHRPIITSSADSLATVAELDGDEPLELGRILDLDVEGRHWARLAVGEDGRSRVEAGLEEVKNLKGRAKRGEDKETAIVLLAQYHIALGQISPAIAFLSSTSSSPPPSSAHSSAWVQRVRALVLLGTCYELSSPPNLNAALDVYALAVQVFETFPDLSLPSAGKAANSGAFNRLRELHRWAERAYFRLCMISSSSPSSHSDTLRWLRLWSTFEEAYSPAFRPQRRLTLRLLYLRTLHISRPRGWRAEAFGLMKRGFEMLKGERRPFPTAGEARSDLEEWSECCVAIWREAGEPKEMGLTVSKILWWTTSQTFASQPVLRHLTRVLLSHQPDDPSDARRTFKLYVQLVSKARETARGDTSIQTNGSTSRTPAPQTPAVEGGDDDVLSGLAEEGDDDRTYFETLLLGARLIGRQVSEPQEALGILDQAKDVLTGSKDGSLANAALRLELQGVWERERGCLLMKLMEKSSDPTTRPTLQAEALKHLIQASTLLPTSAGTFYTLSHAQAVCRQVDESTVSIQSALELDPAMVQGWHLLALLLTAKGKWLEASEVVEVGLEAWEEDEGAAELAELVTSRDFGSSEKQTSIADAPSSTNSEDPLLVDRRLPSSSTLSPLSPADLFAKPTAFDNLETFLQLRMTQALIIERLEGPDEALELQAANFAFFSDRCGRQIMLPGSSHEIGSLQSSTASPPNPAIVVGDYKEKPALTLNLSKTAEASPLPTMVPEEEGGQPGSAGLREPSSATTIQSSLDGKDSVEREFSMININPPTPDPSPLGTTFHLRAENGSPAASGTVSPASTADSGSRSERKPKFIPRHLHPQGTGRRQGGGLGRSASLSKLAGLRHPSSSKNASNASLRSFSNASSIHLRSQRPSPSQSAQEINEPVAAPAPPVATSTTDASKRTPKEARLLSSLWLMSAATFRRRGKMEQALGAIQEAEVIDQTNPEVWVQLGLYHDLLGAHDLAISSFTKGLVCDPLSLSSTVHLARLYLITPPPTNVDLAHGLLNTLTQKQGWDCSEAWYFLAKSCEAQGGREERVRECLVFAARLEDGRSVRAVQAASSRWA